MATPSTALQVASARGRNVSGRGEAGAEPLQLRRTSSLQLPGESPRGRRRAHLVVTALSSVKNSTLTVYASTLSAVGLLDAGPPSEAPLNLYAAMERYRCCCGLCRVRTASALIGLSSILYVSARRCPAG